jgi:hypothetical protein
MGQIATSVSNFFAPEDSPVDTRAVVVWAVLASYPQPSFAYASFQ